jgi:hypothetical protein
LGIAQEEGNMPKSFADRQNGDDESEAWWNARQWIHRTQIIMRRLLGWECFISWEDYQKKYGAQEYGIARGVTFTTPTHVAFCAHRRGGEWEWRVFSPDHEELDSFNPTTSMNDVWILIRALAAKEDVYRDGNHTEEVFFSSIRTTGDENGYAIFDLRGFASLTPVRLCEAVYNAVIHMDGQAPEPEQEA